MSLTSHTRATFSPHLIVLDLMILVTRSERTNNVVQYTTCYFCLQGHVCSSALSSVPPSCTCLIIVFAESGRLKFFLALLFACMSHGYEKSRPVTTLIT